MVRAPAKALKIGRVLKKAAKLPRVSVGRANGGNSFSPLPGESPLVVLRVQVVGCRDLLAKDKDGASDPCVSSPSVQSVVLLTIRRCICSS